MDICEPKKLVLGLYVVGQDIAPVWVELETAFQRRDGPLMTACAVADAA